MKYAKFTNENQLKYNAKVKLKEGIKPYYNAKKTKTGKVMGDLRDGKIDINFKGHIKTVALSNIDEVAVNVSTTQYYAIATLSNLHAYRNLNEREYLWCGPYDDRETAKCEASRIQSKRWVEFGIKVKVYKGKTSFLNACAKVGLKPTL